MRKTDPQCAFGVTSLPLKVTDEKELAKTLFVKENLNLDESSEEEIQPEFSKSQKFRVIGAET